MLLTYCKIQTNLIMPDGPYFMLRWCNKILLNESPRITFMAIGSREPLKANWYSSITGNIDRSFCNWIFSIDSTQNIEANIFINNWYNTLKTAIMKWKIAFCHYNSFHWNLLNKFYSSSLCFSLSVQTKKKKSLVFLFSKDTHQSSNRTLRRMTVNFKNSAYSYLEIYPYNLLLYDLLFYYSQSHYI